MVVIPEILAEAGMIEILSLFAEMLDAVVDVG